MIQQLADHCNIALNKETQTLLHPLGDFSSDTNTSISARNLTGACIKNINFTGILISHAAQNYPMKVVARGSIFLCSRLCYNC